MTEGMYLDIEVAEKIMGWSKSEGYIYPPFGTKLDASIHSYPKYSDDIAWAWTVVERMIKPSLFCVEKNTHGDLCWEAIFQAKDKRAYSAYGDTAAEAICRAALKMKKAEADA